MRVLVLTCVAAAGGLGFLAAGLPGALLFAAGMSVYAWLKGAWS